jgi:hypothetical protein
MIRNIIINITIKINCEFFKLISLLVLIKKLSKLNNCKINIVNINNPVNKTNKTGFFILLTLQLNNLNLHL